MEHTVYFADKAVRFAASDPGGVWYAATPGADALSRTKILKILETHNFLAVVSDNPDATFAAFAAEFTPVVAAGGIVTNDRGEWLMIRRNDRWDLPKGHLECGERIAACAAREIWEETGVEARVVRPLCETLHAYYFPKTARWELKRTHWFELHTSACEGLCPQKEEGIDEVAWCSPEQIARNLAGSFPTIRCVASAMHLPASGR